MNWLNKKAFWISLATLVDIIVKGIPPLNLKGSIKDGIKYVKAYGGLTQSGVPNGYTALDYVENAAGTLVRTDFIPVNISSIKIDIVATASMPSTSTGRTFYIFQARETTATQIFGITGAQATAAISAAGANVSISSATTRTNGHQYRVVWEAKGGNQSFIVDDLTAGTTQSTTNTYASFINVNSPMCLFGNAGTLDPSGSATEVNRIYKNNRIYYAKLWANDKLVLDLIPAKRNSDNVLGFYNKVNGVFFTASEGSLIAGNEIAPTPSNPLDLVCNNGALKVLDKTQWTYITNPSPSQPNAGVFIDSTGLWKTASDRGAGCVIPLTIGKQYTLVFHKKTQTLGTLLRYGQSPQATPTSAGVQLTDWYRGEIADGQMVSFIAKQPYFVMQLSAAAAEAGMMQEAIEVIESNTTSGYTALEYLTTDGDSWAVTNISGATRWVGAGKSSANQTKSQCILGADFYNTSTQTYAANVYIAAQIGNQTAGRYWQINTDDAGKTTISTTTFAEYDVNFGTSVFNGTIGSETVSKTNAVAYTTWNIGICRGANNAIYAFVGDIYRQKAYQNGVLVGDFIPAIRNSDGVVGFYDTVSQTFLTNQGTGTFVAGTVIGDNEILGLTTRNLYNVATDTDGHYIGEDGTIGTNASSCYSALIPVVAGQTYTWSGICGNSGGSNNKRVHAYIDGAWNQQVSLSDITKNQPFAITFTVPAGCNGIRISHWNTDTKGQVELGASATNYIEYNDDTANVANLFKIDTYVDTQEILTGLINHQLGVMVLDGTEQYVETSGSGLVSLVGATASYGVDKNVVAGFCTHAKYKTTPAATAGVAGEYKFGNDLNFYQYQTAFNVVNVAGFKSWLATQYAAGDPVIIVYPLTTAQDEVAPVPQTMQTVAGDNALDIVQAGMSGLEVEVKYTKG